MLAVERFGRAAPDRMEIVRLNFQRSTKQISREDFCEQLRRVLAENFPDETVEKISTAADLEHSLSGMYRAAPFLPCRKENLRTPLKAVSPLHFCGLSEPGDRTRGDLYLFFG